MGIWIAVMRFPSMPTACGQTRFREVQPPNPLRPQIFLRVHAERRAELAEESLPLVSSACMEFRKERAMSPVERFFGFSVKKIEHGGKMHGRFAVAIQRTPEQRINDLWRMKFLDLIKRLAQAAVKALCFERVD